MPIHSRRQRGGFLAGLLAGSSVLVLAGTTTLAAEPGNPSPVLALDGSQVTDIGTQIADSGEAGESGELGESGESGESGEGGEGGVLSSAEPTQIYVANLLAMKGHLLTARELYDAGDLASAEPHFGHPRAEHLSLVEENAGEAGSDELGERLEHLEEAVLAGGEAGEGGEGGAVEAEWEEAVAVINDDIDDAIDSSDAPLAALVADVHLVLRQAAHEYEEAIKDGVFAEPVEYQDGRGFYRAAREEIESRADAFRAHNADKYAELVAALDAAGRAWPSAIPPASPPLTIEELNAAIANFEIAALAFR